MHAAKNNIRTTTSSFVTRIQCIENLNRVIHNKQGDVTYLFYNYAKNFFWTEVGVKAKVSCFAFRYPALLFNTSTGTSRANIIRSISHMS